MKDYEQIISTLQEKIFALEANITQQAARIAELEKCLNKNSRNSHKLTKGFTLKYNVNRLVDYEVTSEIVVAIEREKQIKGWSRHKKNALVQAMNPDWNDLCDSLC